MVMRPRGEMDITSVFGTAVGGSNPSEGTYRFVKNYYYGILYGQYFKFESCQRVSFSGRTRPCQGRGGSSILPTRTGKLVSSLQYVLLFFY